MEVPTMVIKVKYQEMLRRFHVRVTDEEIDLNMDQLREKLLTLFNLTPNAELMLTYIDEDGDEVALVDDDDLRDVAKQRLDRLIITVKLNSEKNGIRHRPSASSTPLKSQCVQQPLENFPEVLKTVPDPLYGTIMKLSCDLISKASSPTSGFNDLIEFFSKVVFSYLAHRSDFQHATKTNNMEPSKVDGATLKVPSNDRSDKQSLKYNESFKNQNQRQFTSIAAEKFFYGGLMESPSVTRRFHDVVFESQYPVIAESKFVPDTVAKKEMAHDKPPMISYPRPVLDTDFLVGKVGTANTFPTENDTNIRPILKPYPSKFTAFNPIQLNHVGGSTSSIWAPSHGVSKLRGLWSSSSPTDELPISSRPVENDKSFQSHLASRAVTSSRCKSRDTFHYFHCGILCDGCGVHPITGPRFKSKVKEDYDLCMICHAEKGNASDYIRIDRPVVYPHHVLYDSHGGVKDSVLQDSRGFKVKSCLSKMDSCFIKDVNIADDTVMAPLTSFTKIWRLKNNGIVAWPKKTTICCMGGDEFSKEISVELKIPATGLAIDQELDVAVDCIAPELPGKYESFWELASPSGQRFGQRIWIRIEVVAFAAKPQENIKHFDLNFPPLSSLANGPKMIDAVPESITADESTEDEGRSFKSADLNEAVSMMSEDNLNLDDASDFSEWETMLDELFDMN